MAASLRQPLPTSNPPLRRLVLPGSVSVAERAKKRRTGAREGANQRSCGYGPGEFDMAKSCLQVAPCPHLKSKEAARDVNYVPVLNIFWFRWVAVNGRLKVKGLGALFTVDYASEMNIIRAPIVARVRLLP